MNRAEITGIIESAEETERGGTEIRYSARAERPDGKTDMIKILARPGFKAGDRIFASGRVCYRMSVPGGRRGFAYVRPDVIRRQEEDGEDKNEVRIEGIVSFLKEPIPFRNRSGVRRSFMLSAGEGPSIPCVAWGKKAKSLRKGDRISAVGIMQSRSLTRSGDTESDTIHEVSVTRWQKIEKDG